MCRLGIPGWDGQLHGCRLNVLLNLLENMLSLGYVAYDRDIVIAYGVFIAGRASSYGSVDMLISCHDNFEFIKSIEHENVAS